MVEPENRYQMTEEEQQLMGRVSEWLRSFMEPVVHQSKATTELGKELDQFIAGGPLIGKVPVPEEVPGYGVKFEK